MISLAEIIQVHPSSSSNTWPRDATRGRFKQVHSLFAPCVKIKLAWQFWPWAFLTMNILLHIEYIEYPDAGWLNISFVYTYYTLCILIDNRQLPFWRQMGWSTARDVQWFSGCQFGDTLKTLRLNKPSNNIQTILPSKNIGQEWELQLFGGVEGRLKLDMWYASHHG